MDTIATASRPCAACVRSEAVKSRHILKKDGGSESRNTVQHLLPQDMLNLLRMSRLPLIL